jgi:hypothetical protein
MIREAYQDLLQWKARPNRKPLIIQGARQVGKTWLMKTFGSTEYAQLAYFNFEQSTMLYQIFQQGFDVRRIITSLEIALGKSIQSENTLLVFDEIQACPEAITALKYFQENAPEYHIVAAGSLLGVAIHKGVSFPVGKVEFLSLSPLNFHEYLLAMKADSLLYAIQANDPKILKPFGDQLGQHVRQYCFLGGMPEVIFQFATNNDFFQVREIQLNIIQAYENDFSKHAPIAQLPRIRMVWQSIVGQLSKENSKFIYSVIRTGARAKDFEMAIDWLKDAGLIHKVVRISKPGIPISAYADWSDFKIYLNDVGLLAAMAGISQQSIIQGNELFEEFKGVITEQFVCQQINAKSIACYYWSPEGGTSEVDFVIQRGDWVVPIEVKSGLNVRSRSLRVYYDKYQPTRCIRTSLAAYEEQSWMTNIPLYSFSQWLGTTNDIFLHKP